jgi:hypothetical protein
LIIHLSPEELNRCREFSYECAKHQQQIEFGQSDTVARGVREISRDNFIGKIAEVAFSKMMANSFNIIVPLDFNYYPRGKWDREADAPTGIVNLVGSASIMKLKHGISTTRVLWKGECIPGTRTPLQADNFAISFNDLESDWVMVIKYILENEPPPLDTYPNTYSG